MKVRNLLDCARLGCGACLAVVVTAATWSWRAESVLDAVRQERRAPRLSTRGGLVAAGTLPTSPVVLPDPDHPESRRADRSWRLFTSPLVVRDATGRMMVHAPGDARVTSPTLAGMTLATVRRVPYPLQLRGHFGTSDSRVAIFAVLKSGRTILARPGDRLAEYDVRLECLEIGSEADSGHPLAGRSVATATLRRLTDDGEFTIDNRTVALTDELVAEIVVAGAKGDRRREVRIGELIGDSEHYFRVESITERPAQVRVLSRETDRFHVLTAAESTGAPERAVPVSTVGGGPAARGPSLAAK